MGEISLGRWVEVTATTPAQMFGLFPKKGLIAPGSDADIVIYDPNGTHTISAATHHMNVDYSAYEGMEVKGRATTVLSRGTVIVENDTYVGVAGAGKFLSAGSMDACDDDGQGHVNGLRISRPDNAPASDVVKLAQRAEEAGFTHFWTFDSAVLWQEPFVIYSQILSSTSRIKVGPMVTNPQTRDWSVTASLFATLNDMFGNRTVCGIGRGDSAVRYTGGSPSSLAVLGECMASSENWPKAVRH